MFVMAHNLGIKFKGIEELQVEFLEIPWIEQFLILCHKNYLYDRPVVRDSNTVNYENFLQLVDRCNHVLGWNWCTTQDQLRDWSITIKMHKDIEAYLATGYHNIPDGLDHLLHDLHHGLHSMQGLTSHVIQLEWFNDDGFPLPDLEFLHDNTLGAVHLQNPFVGHPPMWIYQQNDFSNVWQTCKFHDFVRPGIVIKIDGELTKAIKTPSLHRYLHQWQTMAPDFVEFHSQDKMIKNSGQPVIGYVTNNHVLLELKKQNIKEFEYFRFDPALMALEKYDESVKLKRSVTQSDYEKMAGLDWPSYQDFVEDREIPDWVWQEIKAMTRP
jgi:hypothetical protein